MKNTKFLIVVFCLMIFVMVGEASAAVIWDGTVNSGDKQKDSTHWFATNGAYVGGSCFKYPYSATAVPAPGRPGHYAFREEVHDGDNCPNEERVQLQRNPQDTPFSTRNIGLGLNDVWYGLSVQLGDRDGSNFPHSGDAWMAIFGFESYHYYLQTSGEFNMRFDNRADTISLRPMFVRMPTTRFDHYPYWEDGSPIYLELGKWYDYAFHIKWSKNKDGFIVAYMRKEGQSNYQKVMEVYNVQTKKNIPEYPNDEMIDKMSFYREASESGTSVVYYMDKKIGTTMADVTYGGITTPSTPDTQNPTVAITCPSGTDVTYDTPLTTLSGTATDDVGIKEVWIKIGSGGTWQKATLKSPNAASTDWSLSGMTGIVNGLNTVYVKVVDTSNNDNVLPGGNTGEFIKVTLNARSNSGSGLSGDLLFDGSFKSTDTVNYAGLPNHPNLGKFTGYSCVPRSDSLALVDASTLSGGRSGLAAKFTIGTGSAYDCNGNQHDQITTFDPYIPTTATDVWYGWSQRVTSTWQGSYAFGLTEGYQFPCSTCAQSGFLLGTSSSGKIEIRNNCARDATSSCSWQMDAKYNFQPNVWEDWAYHIKWARDNTGFAEVYKNGELAWSKYNYPTRTTLYDHYDHRLGIYRASTVTIPYVLYVLNPKIGTTRASVEYSSSGSSTTSNPPPTCTASTTNPNPQPPAASLTLKPGWNQISSPVAAGIDIAAIEQSCKIISYANRKLWSWDAQTQAWTNPTKVEPFKGYWISVKDACTIPLSGTPAKFSSLQLYSGWNKISASGTFSAIQGTCTGHILNNVIWHRDENTKSWTHPTALELDKGYWILTDQDCVLSG